ncbi:MAG: iron uptake transporter deferrochelatase/peroxidase subunit [Ardenticatenales bacterium]
MTSAQEGPVPSHGLTRRRLMVAGGLGLAAGAGAVAARDVGAPHDRAGSTGVVVPYYGPHQAGIATATQNCLHFAALDLTTKRREDVAELLRRWTDAAARMCGGEAAATVDDNPLAPPVDTGEAHELGPARLTVTFGFGVGMFTSGGQDRYGLAARRPAALADLPPFRGDHLEPGRSDGDLAIQACADDPQVAFHAVRNLIRIARGTAVLRWSQLGFSRTATNSQAQATPRNLMGFKDGTNNIRAEDAAAMSEHVWVGDEGPLWMRGGSYVVTRRIRMHIEHWDRSSLGDQEATIGRIKSSGAAFGRTRESDPVDLGAKDAGGALLVPLDAHVRLAAPISNDGVRILRRGYSFTDGVDPVTGGLDAGLFFIGFQRDPRKQFVPIQQRLAADDALNEYIRPTSSAVFACPAGTVEGRAVGAGLFEG